KGHQTIKFGSLANKPFSDPDFTVSATASSALAVSFTPSGNCTMTGNSVHLTGAGSCTVTASQPGDSNYNAAADVPQSFSVAKSPQTIGNDAIASTNLRGNTSITPSIASTATTRINSP